MGELLHNPKVIHVICKVIHLALALSLTLHLEIQIPFLKGGDALI